MISTAPRYMVFTRTGACGATESKAGTSDSRSNCSIYMTNVEVDSRPIDGSLAPARPSSVRLINFNAREYGQIQYNSGAAMTNACGAKAFAAAVHPINIGNETATPHARSHALPRRCEWDHPVESVQNSAKLAIPAEYQFTISACTSTAQANNANDAIRRLIDVLRPIPATTRRLRPSASRCSMNTSQSPATSAELGQLLVSLGCSRPCRRSQPKGTAPDAEHRRQGENCKAIP